MSQELSRAPIMKWLVLRTFLAGQAGEALHPLTGLGAPTHCRAIGEREFQHDAAAGAACADFDSRKTVRASPVYE